MSNDIETYSKIGFERILSQSEVAINSKPDFSKINAPLSDDERKTALINLANYGKHCAQGEIKDQDFDPEAAKQIERMKELSLYEPGESSD